MIQILALVLLQKLSFDLSNHLIIKRDHHLCMLDQRSKPKRLIERKKIALILQIRVTKLSFSERIRALTCIQEHGCFGCFVSDEVLDELLGEGGVTTRHICS